MSDEEKFLARWSRRKREAAEQESVAPPERAPETEATEPGREGAKQGTEPRAPKETAGAEPEAEPKFDLSSLPPIEAIGPDTDIRPFLRPGVPADLTRAALRRAWSVDPAIRDYIGPSENSWDFTTAGPNGVPGFDFGDPGVDVRQLAAQLFARHDEPESSGSPVSESSTEGKVPEAQTEPLIAAAPATPADHDMLKPERSEIAEPLVDMAEQQLTASQQQPEISQDGAAADSYAKEPVRRRHGSALPS